MIAGKLVKINGIHMQAVLMNMVRIQIMYWWGCTGGGEGD